MEDLVNVTDQNDTINIKIKTLDSRTFIEAIDRTIRVFILKILIEVKYEIKKEQQRLLFRGRVLKDNLSLSDNQIQEDHTLYLIQIQDIPIIPERAIMSRSQIFRVDIENLVHLVQLQYNSIDGLSVQVIPNYMEMYDRYMTQLMLRLGAYANSRNLMGNDYEVDNRIPIPSPLDMRRQLNRGWQLIRDEVQECIDNYIMLRDNLNVGDPSEQRWRQGRVTVVYGTSWENLGRSMLALGLAISRSRMEVIASGPRLEEVVASSPTLEEDVGSGTSTSSQEEDDDEQLSSAQLTIDEEPSHSD